MYFSKQALEVNGVENYQFSYVFYSKYIPIHCHCRESSVCKTNCIYLSQQKFLYLNYTHMYKIYIDMKEKMQTLFVHIIFLLFCITLYSKLYIDDDDDDDDPFYVGTINNNRKI